MNFFTKLLLRFLGENPALVELRLEKGICDEYVELFRRTYPHPNKKRKIELADVLISLSRYDEAEAVLDSMKATIVDDDDTHGTYCNTLMTLYIETYRKEDGLALFRKYQKFLDLYFTSSGRNFYAPAYYDNAAVLLAMNGYTDLAGDYLGYEKQWVEHNQEKYPASVYYPTITYIHMLTVLGKTEAAQQEAAKVRRSMEQFAFKTAPQRDALFGMLEKALH